MRKLLVALGATGVLAVTALGQVALTQSEAPTRVSAPAAGGLLRPSTQAAFVAAVQQAIANCQVVVFDGTSRFTATQPMRFTLGDCGHNPVGFVGNGMTITSKIDDGSDVIRIDTRARNRSLLIQGLHIDGGGHEGRRSGNCLRLQAAKDLDLYKFTLRDIWVDFCGRNGVDIEGAVFEGAIYNLQTENNTLSGIRLAHDTVPGGGQGIVSNIFLIGANASRNRRYGVEAANGATSIQLTQFSLVNNHMGGALFPWGARSVTSGNCENSGSICIDMPASTYTSAIWNVEASTDCHTAGKDGTGAMKYLYRYQGPAEKLNQAFNSVVSYGKSCTGVQLRAP